MITSNTDAENIYFPCDGEQPTTEQAVEWSCARVGSNEPDHPITNWYVEMFGGQHTEKNALKMGFAYPPEDQTNRIQNPIEIITLKDSGKNEDNDMDGRTISIDDLNQQGRILSRKDAFWYTFRQIAANPVGRVLLYRILIEIRRVSDNGNGAQAVSNEITGDLLMQRNNLRNIVIEWNDKDSHNDNCIRFNTNKREYPAISAFIETLGSVQIEMFQCNQIQRLFHELLHHFHQLQDKRRHDEEKNSVSIDDFFDNKRLSSYFWHDIKNKKIKKRFLSILPWINFNNTIQVNLEELRTICGGPSIFSLSQKKLDLHLGAFCGDDLSENLFLLSLNQPLRFGHEKVPFFEDMRVIARELEILEEVKGSYGIEKDLYFTQKPISPRENPPLHGLGNFAITGESVTKVLQN